jgi:hypothetical protein
MAIMVLTGQFGTMRPGYGRRKKFQSTLRSAITTYTVTQLQLSAITFSAFLI